MCFGPFIVGTTPLFKRKDEAFENQQKVGQYENFTSNSGGWQKEGIQ